MNSEQLFRAIGNIDDNKIESAINYNRKKSSVSLKRCFRILAACVSIIIGSSIVITKPWYSEQNEEHLSSESKDDGNNVIGDFALQYPYVNYKGDFFSYTGNIATSSEIGDYLMETTVMKTKSNSSDQIPCSLYTFNKSNNNQTIVVKIYGEYYLYFKLDGH